jgi:DNA polymerase III alpha subunit (gram-positive type)
MYLFLDTETGGLTPRYSLLTLAAIVADKDFNPIRGGTDKDTLYLEIRHPTYIVSPEALTINKIDLTHHSARGVKLEEAKQKFEDFLQTARVVAGDKLIPIGHNLSFDLKFVWAQLMSEDVWRRYCQHQALDTMIAARFFKAAGVIDCNCNLTALCELFHVDTADAHNALGDTRSTMAVARALMEIARNVTDRGPFAAAAAAAR